MNETGAACRRPISPISEKMTELIAAFLLSDIRHMIDTARARAVAAVNAELTLLYWQVGRRIRDHVLRGECAGYGQDAHRTMAVVLQRAPAPERTSLSTSRHGPSSLAGFR